MDTPTNTETKPKRQLTELQMRALAEGRKKSIDKRQKQAALSQVRKQEEKENFEREYQEKVLKKNQPQPQKIEETDEPVYPQPQAPPQDDDDIENEPLPPKSKTAPRAKPQPKEVNYKQEYYRYKLEQLTAQQQHQNHMQTYMQLPPYFHAVDVAKQSLKTKADDAVLKLAYRQIFPS